jgi:hypothetical protein
MLFITNRRFVNGRRSEAGREVTFDLDDNEPGCSVYFCERTAPGQYRELLSGPFFGRLRRSERQQILLYLQSTMNRFGLWWPCLRTYPSSLSR